jgi:LDH2 family malate/lactate/ureidoglycolate dehydrogenase
MKIKISELEDLIKKCLRTKFDEEETNLISEVLMFGQLSGKTTHGLVRLLVGSSVLSSPKNTKPVINSKSKLSSLIDGNNNPGMLVGALAVNEVIKLAKDRDFGIVGTHNSTSTSGCLSFYLEKIAKANLIGLIMAQSPASTPPFGGIEPLFGTNPISFGFPTDSQPLIFDMGTSAISFGAILKAQATSTKLPEGVVLDAEGNPTTDPEKAIHGATLPFDGSHKGAGLAMVVEILSGLWPGADFSGLNKAGGWGNTFIAFSPNLLSNPEEFKNKTSQLIDRIKHSKTKTSSQIRIPGENSLNTRDQAFAAGTVDVDEKLITLAQNYLKTGKL